jgi:hypothetical protein
MALISTLKNWVINIWGFFWNSVARHSKIDSLSWF